MFEITYVPDWCLFIIVALIVVTTILMLVDMYGYSSRVSNLFIAPILALFCFAMLASFLGVFTVTSNNYNISVSAPELLQVKTVNSDKTCEFIASAVGAERVEIPTSYSIDDVGKDGKVTNFVGFKDGKRMGGSFYFQDSSMYITLFNDSGKVIEVPLDK